MTVGNTPYHATQVCGLLVDPTQLGQLTQHHLCISLHVDYCAHARSWVGEMTHARPCILPEVGCMTRGTTPHRGGGGVAKVFSQFFGNFLGNSGKFAIAVSRRLMSNSGSVDWEVGGYWSEVNPLLGDPGPSKYLYRGGTGSSKG